MYKTLNLVPSIRVDFINDNSSVYYKCLLILQLPCRIHFITLYHCTGLETMCYSFTGHLPALTTPDFVPMHPCKVLQVLPRAPLFTSPKTGFALQLVAHTSTSPRRISSASAATGLCIEWEAEL